MGALFFFLFVLNLAISAWNAYAVGTVWIDSRHAGGYRRFMAWMGAVMSAAGFSWCYLLVLVLTAEQFQWIGPHAVKVALELGYLTIVPAILFSGYTITFDSWVEAYRRRTLGSYGVAGWNTFASLHNTYEAVKFMPAAFSDVGDFFKGEGSSKDEDDDVRGKAVMIVLALVAVALVGGALTTTAIIQKTVRACAARPLAALGEE